MKYKIKLIQIIDKQDIENVQLKTYYLLSESCCFISCLRNFARNKIQAPSELP